MKAPYKVICENCYREMYRSKTTTTNRDVPRERRYGKCFACKPRKQWNAADAPIYAEST